MTTLLKFLRLEFLPASVDLALMILRVWLGLTMLLHHGLDKMLTFSDKAAGFPDPLGVGHQVSMGLAIFGEFVCAGLLTIGLFGRFAALGLAINMSVAFFLVHKAAMAGEFSGELPFIYLAGFFALLIAGPGRFSLDAILFKGGGRKP